MRNILIATSFILGLGFYAEAQPRKAAPAGGKHEVLDASRQTTRYRGTTETSVEYRFSIVWKGQTPPATGFFYRNGKEWKETTIARPERRPFSANSKDYMMVETTILPKDIKNGDKLMLTTHRHDHDEEEMPAAVRAMAKQGLFYATGSGKSLSWKLIPVTPRTLPDRQQ